MNPLTGIPAPLSHEIQQLWAAEVAGGRALYESNGSTIGRTGQWKVSRFLRNHGIVPNTDGRWERVRDHGRDLYYGRATP